MQKLRASLLVIAVSTILGMSPIWAADDHPSDPLWDGSNFNATTVEDASHSPSLSTDANDFSQLESGAGPRINEQGEPPPGMDSEFFAGDDDEDVVYLSGELPPAYSFGYNRVQSALTWIPGHDDRFGWLSYESFGGVTIDSAPSLITGIGFHVLDGPVQSDMPPRLFDFSIGVADRRLIQPNIGYDIVFRVGAFSDFEGDASDGVRYPSHAVTFLRLTSTSELVLGIDYLDRDDIRLLPVVGVIWSAAEWLKVEVVFPRPRVAARIQETSTWIYLAGELGGGTWAIEQVNLVDDNATYRDLRLVLGWETLVADSLSSSFEVGYVFDRKLSYSSNIGDYEPPNGFMLRMAARY